MAAARKTETACSLCLMIAISPVTIDARAQITANANATLSGIKMLVSGRSATELMRALDKRIKKKKPIISQLDHLSVRVAGMIFTVC